MKYFRLFFARMLLPLVLILGAQLAVSHSWLDVVEVEGKSRGYIRDYNGRDKDVDTHNSYLMGSTKDSVCKSNQQSAKNSPSFPRLKAAPGDRVVAFHTENGHVSLPSKSNSKSGLTYWFGTTNQRTIPSLAEILKWIDAGVEDGGPGQYLGASTYDDGRCAEPNQSQISAQRGVGPTGVGKSCKDSGFIVPEDLDPGTIFTVFWIWNFSEHFGPDPYFFEWYSSCLDVEIVAGTSGGGGGSTPTRPSAKYGAPSRAHIYYSPAEAF